jgi:hypothetical protein
MSSDTSEKAEKTVNRRRKDEHNPGYSTADSKNAASPVLVEAPISGLPVLSHALTESCIRRWHNKRQQLWLSTT